MSAASTQKKKNTLRASMRKHCASGLRAPQAFENGALRHKQLHAGKSDRTVVFLPSQSLPRTERLHKRFCVVTPSPLLHPHERSPESPVFLSLSLLDILDIHITSPEIEDGSNTSKRVPIFIYRLGQAVRTLPHNKGSDSEPEREVHRVNRHWQ